MIAATYVLVVSGSFFLLASLTSPSRYLSSLGMIKIVSIRVFKKIPLMKWKTIFDMMFLLDITFPSSTLSLSGDFFIPPLDANVYTCIFIFGIRMPKKIVFDAHSRFSFVSVVFSSLTITSKKFADEEDPSHSFSNTYLQHAPCSNKKITLNYNSLFYAPYHTWQFWLQVNKFKTCKDSVFIRST